MVAHYVYVCMCTCLCKHTEVRVASRNVLLDICCLLNTNAGHMQLLLGASRLTGQHIRVSAT